MNPALRRLASTAWWSLPALFAAAAWSHTLRGSLAWDDLAFANEMASDSGGGMLAFRKFFGVNPSYFRPLWTVNGWLVLSLAGEVGAVWHLENVLLHVLATALVAVLVRRFVEDRVVAGLAATLFAVLPGVSEAVAWPTARVDLQVALAILAATLLQLRARDAGPGSRRAAAATLAALAGFVGLLAKETAVMWIPLAAAAAFLAPEPHSISSAQRALWWRDRILWLPHVLALVAYVGLRRAALGGAGDVGLAVGLSTWRAWAFYARESLGLGGAPPFVEHLHGGGVGSLLVGATIGVAAIVAVARWKRTPASAFGALWFLLTLALPVAVAMRPMSASVVSVRQLYAPAVGLAIALVPLLRIAHARSPVAARLGVAVFSMGLAILGYSRSAPWMSDESLWRRAMQDEPASAYAYANFAENAVFRNDLPAARKAWSHAAWDATEIHPGSRARALTRLAEIAFLEGHPRDAIPALEAAASLSATLDGATLCSETAGLFAKLPESGSLALVDVLGLAEFRIVETHARTSVVARLAASAALEAANEPAFAAAVLSGVRDIAPRDSLMGELLPARLERLAAAAEMDSAEIAAVQHAIAGGDIPGALAAARRLPDPRRDGFLLVVARAARNPENIDAALPLLEELAARHPDLPLIWVELAEVLPVEREPDAFAALDRAQTLAPAWARPHFQRALLHDRRGDVSAALPEWAACVMRHEADPSARAYARERLRVLTNP